MPIAPSTGLLVQLACIWEATARKPGNVHRWCDFDDLKYEDFLLSAAAIGPVLDGAAQRPIGETVLEAIRATRQVVATNTNLGMVLLLTPLAAVPPSEDLRAGVARVLAGLTVADARLTYEAIRLAVPGGMGQAAEQDIRTEPNQTLRQVMELAADRDLIARQYAEDFKAVFEVGLPAMCHGLEHTHSLEGAIVYCHLSWMACHPDSLIARKRGLAEAQEAARRAREVLEAGWPGTPEGRNCIAKLDTWLRAEGHARNPGTSADLVAASLFAALRLGHLTSGIPWSVEWPGGPKGCFPTSLLT